MNIHASPAAQRTASRHSGPDSDGAPAHEIKYRQDAAGYVTAMLAELRQIAGKAGFDKLVKSLDAAYYEAYGALDAKAREAAAAPGKGAPAANGNAEEKTSEPMEPNRG
jgi:hypothetical protein